MVDYKGIVVLEGDSMLLKHKITVDKCKEIIVLLIMAVFMMSFIWYQYDVIASRSYGNLDPVALARRFLVIAIVATVGVFISYIWIVKKRASINRVYAFIVIALGLAYMVIFLPYTVPDEPHHYFEAFGLSNYFTFNFEQANAEFVMLRQSDIEWYQSTYSNTQSAEHFYQIQKSIELFSDNNTLVEFELHKMVGSSNAPFGYVFSAIGIAVARVFNLSPIITFYFGRVFNLVSYTIMGLLAIRKIPYGKMAILVISALPMSLHLIASYSYDAQIVAFVMLFVAQVLYMKEKKDNITLKDIILCTILGMLVAPSKLVYLPVVLLVFIIPKEKFGALSSKAFLIKAGIFTVSLVFLLLLQLKSFVSTASNPAISWSEEDARSLSWIIAHPIDTVKVFVDTLFYRGEFYLNSLVGYSLGWFQVVVPTYCYVPFFGFLAYSFMTRENEVSRVSFGDKIWSIILIIASFVLTLTSMLLAWTPKSYPTVEGVQGRYFIPLLVLLIPILRNKFITVKSSADKYMTFILIYWNLFVGIQFFVKSFV